MKTKSLIHSATTTLLLVFSWSYKISQIQLICKMSDLGKINMYKHDTHLRWVLDGLLYDVGCL